MFRALMAVPFASALLFPVLPTTAGTIGPGRSDCNVITVPVDYEDRVCVEERQIIRHAGAQGTNSPGVPHAVAASTAAKPSSAPVISAFAMNLPRFAEKLLFSSMPAVHC